MEGKNDRGRGQELREAASKRERNNRYGRMGKILGF